MDYVLIEPLPRNILREATSATVTFGLGACLAEFCGTESYCLYPDDPCDPDIHDSAIVDCEADWFPLFFEGALTGYRMEYSFAPGASTGTRIPLGPLPTRATTGCDPIIRPDQLSAWENGVEFYWTGRFDPAQVTIGVDDLVRAGGT